MSLENAKKFITQVREDETLQERTANSKRKRIFFNKSEIHAQILSAIFKSSTSCGRIKHFVS